MIAYTRTPSVRQIFKNRGQLTYQRLHRLQSLLRRWTVDVCASRVGAKHYSSHGSDGEPHVSEKKIRNFSVIAHIDHGKSTLADRILEICGAICKDAKNKQVLDKLEVERERGITVKAQTATVIHRYDGETYTLNLIDTPGHVDFTYEVSRSLAACQGVVLLVDSTQGIQAQTMANFYLAFASDLVIIPVLNKIDLKTSDVESVKSQLVNVFEMNEADILSVSAKTGQGVVDVLDEVVRRIPPPSGEPNGKFRSLLFDSWFDRFKGAVVNVAVIDGKIDRGDSIVAAHSRQVYEVKEVGTLTPDPKPKQTLRCGEVGYLIAGMKTTKEAQIGDTLYKDGDRVDILPGFRRAKPVVFAGIYPLDQAQNVAMRMAIERLTLNDSSVTVSVENSAALGQGWRFGFLGLLHMEVFTERLDREHDIQCVVTSPTVTYRAKIFGKKNVKKYGSDEIEFANPADFPDRTMVAEYSEPMVIGTVITPDRYLGKVMALCTECRGVQKDSRNIDDTRVMFQYKLPLNEIIVNFFDELKRSTSGYASFDYEDHGYETSDLRKLEFLLNGKAVEELATIVHASTARERAKFTCGRLKEVIPAQLFKITIQGAVGSKIVAREDIAALKKNVLAKCYGGDITRKMKLLKRQAEGKKRMRQIGNVQVPSDAFIKILRK